MTKIATAGAEQVVIRRISEQVQSDQDLMLKLKDIGIQPGREVTLSVSDDGVRVTSGDRVGGAAAELPRHVAVHVFVTRS
jgi:DtxR family transcriptional regulator, Mn-dependent transcriptional regulator